MILNGPFERAPHFNNNKKEMGREQRFSRSHEARGITSAGITDQRLEQEPIMVRKCLRRDPYSIQQAEEVLFDCVFKYNHDLIYTTLNDSTLNIEDTARPTLLEEIIVKENFAEFIFAN